MRVVPFALHFVAGKMADNAAGDASKTSGTKCSVRGAVKKAIHMATASPKEPTVLPPPTGAAKFAKVFYEFFVGKRTE